MTDTQLDIPEYDNLGTNVLAQEPVASAQGPVHKIALTALIIAAVMGAVFWFTLRSGPPIEDETFVSRPSNNSAQVTYRKALGETDIALRWVRLKDIVRSYPDTREAILAEKQARLLLREEAKDWQVAQLALADKRLGFEEKSVALSQYQSRWRDEVRADLIAEYQASLPEQDNMISRKLTDKTSLFAVGGSPGALAGGPVKVQEYRPPQPTQTFAPVETLRGPQIEEATVRRTVRPRYPRRALRRGIEATVILSLDVSARGRVTDTRVISATADRYRKDFIKAAERAAKDTRFTPRRVDGKAVPTQGFMRQFVFRVGEN